MTNLSHSNVQAIVLTIAVFLSAGCSAQDYYRSQTTNEDDVSRRLDTTLVRATNAAAIRPSSLITLASHEDLNQKVIEARGNVLLDFYADWCGPCQVQGKHLHELENVASQAQTTIIKINVDQHPDLARQLQVSGLPTLILVKDGEIAVRQTGLVSKQALTRWIQKRPRAETSTTDNQSFR